MSATAAAAATLLLLLAHTTSPIHAQQCKACAAGLVTIRDGAYNDLLVVVDGSVSYDPNVVPNIMEYIQSASDALYNATKHVSGRTFGTVTILLPELWPDDTALNATTESVDRATFSVMPDTDEWGSNPHTVRLSSECGTPGVVTVLPESFVRDKSEAQKYGKNIGKTLVHEWAHLRYGLYDESAWEDGGDAAPCNSIQDTSAVPRCAESVTGHMTPGQESGSCVFVPDDVQTSGASLLYAPYLDSVFTFCDDAAQDSGLIHNANAQNMQNSRCNMRSAWSVMRDHPDFAPNVQAAASAEKVQFRVVRDNRLRISIVMDVSGSMSTANRLQWMQQSVKNFLLSLLYATQLTEQPVMVGMTKFSTAAQKTHDLVQLDEFTIDSLIAAIPPVTEGSTSIGAGILMGLQVLETPGYRSMVIVFTDGQENTAPYIVDVQDEVCAFNATVYGMIVANVISDHPLIKLGEQTCGGSCVVDDTSSTTIYDCLWNAMKERLPQIAPVQLNSGVVTVNKMSNYTDTCMVDSAFSSGVVFRFEWPAAVSTGGKCELITVALMSPDGTLATAVNVTASSPTLFELRGSSYAVGEWQYTVTNPSVTTDCNVRITVEGDASVAGPNDPNYQEPAKINVQFSKKSLALNITKSAQDNTVIIYVQVTKGTTPVIGATVHAIITTSNQDEFKLVLLDNGAGADVRKGDGIYSRYFVDFNGNGAYGVRVEVMGEKGKVHLNMKKRSYAHPAPPLPQYRVLQLTSTAVSTEPFQRSSVGGFIDISGYTPAFTPQAMFPPSQIIDLMTSVDSSDVKTLAVSWTSVGAYFDQGNASYYEMRISYDPLNLLTNFDQAFPVTSSMIVGGSSSPSSLTSPLAAGSAEQLLLSLANTNFSAVQVNFYIAIVAVNSYGNRSPLSNVRRFDFLPATTTTTAGPASSTQLPPPSDSTFPGWAIALIVIGCVLFLVGIIIVIVVCYKKSHQKQNHYESSGPAPMHVNDTYKNGAGVYHNDDELAYYHRNPSAKAGYYGGDPRGPTPAYYAGPQDHKVTDEV